jgi:hypothetical protein
MWRFVVVVFVFADAFGVLLVAFEYRPVRTEPRLVVCRRRLRRAEEREAAGNDGHRHGDTQGAAPKPSRLPRPIRALSRLYLLQISSSFSGKDGFAPELAITLP